MEINVFGMTLVFYIVYNFKLCNTGIADNNASSQKGTVDAVQRELRRMGGGWGVNPDSLTFCL